MINALSQAAENIYGLKSDISDLEKMKFRLERKYGRLNREILEKVFLSGEAAEFLTVNETYFFREPAHFFLLKELLKNSGKTTIEICCAAVATGCEAYSVAMCIEDFNKNAEHAIYYKIDAFDLNPKAIETANCGLYRPRTKREDGNIFHYLLSEYLKKNRENLEISGLLKKNINFFVHNLMIDIPSKTYDVIFFRNAFMYFSQKNRQRILSNLSNVLKESGILIMGTAETAGVRHEDFEQKYENGVFYFFKKNSDASPTADAVRYLHEQKYLI